MPPPVNINSIAYLKSQAALKIVALGEKARLQGAGFSVEQSRAQLSVARARHK